MKFDPYCLSPTYTVAPQQMKTKEQGGGYRGHRYVM